MHETELERERHRALVAEGLVAAVTEAARRVSGYLPGGPAFTTGDFAREQAEGIATGIQGR